MLLFNPECGSILSTLVLSFSPSFSLLEQQVEGIGTFVVPFGSEPAATLTVFADRVVGAGGTLNAQGAAQIMERACAEVRVVCIESEFEQSFECISLCIFMTSRDFARVSC